MNIEKKKIVSDQGSIQPKLHHGGCFLSLINSSFSRQSPLLTMYVGFYLLMAALCSCRWATNSPLGTHLLTQHRPMNTCTPSVLYTKTYSYHRTVLRQLTETEPVYYLQLARFQEELSPSCLQSNKKSQYSSTYTRALFHIMLETYDESDHHGQAEK